jgi:replicative DNA helicase
LISVDVPSINEAVGRGFRDKSLYMFVGKVHVGKTLFLCHLAASFKKSGHSGVYFTAEMSENAITHRIDANVLNMEMSELGKNLGRESYMDKVNSAIKTFKKGEWFVKEYPPAFSSKNNLTAYLQELKLKKGITPDVVIVDYINQFASARLPPSAMQNSYLYMKSVTEEMRALAVENSLPLITATQLNRDSANQGVDSADMTGVGESFSIPQLSDWMGVIVQPPELYEEKKYLLKVLKNRFEENLYEVYTLGVDRSHMRLFELSEDQQEVPIVVKDRMHQADLKRQAVGDDERIFVFQEDMK